MSEIIGTSSQAIDDYVRAAEQIFHRVRQRLQTTVVQAFALTYEGPDAETEFNPGLIRVATSVVAQMDEAMGDFATALSVITSNISRSLGGSEITVTYAPQPVELPPPPGVAADDYRIDVAGFEHFVSAELPDLRSAVGALIDENQQTFGAIPRATAEQRGWSGSAREHAQHVIVPNLSDQMRATLSQVTEEIASFMTTARDAARSADAAGIG
ncbi:MAG: hypothetical protein AAF962_26995 [Actinomycetota bacterium]